MRIFRMGNVSQARSAALDVTFAALADPTRRAILARLAKGEASVNELVEPSHLSQPTISKHLKYLARAGLVERRRDAQFRLCRLNPAPLEAASAWLDDYRAFWEGSLDRLAAYVKDLQRTSRDVQPTKGAARRGTRQ
jgi:DNA-binding transcriptional ArsR family regulator